MTADGSEVRFWAYFDTTNQFRVLDDFARHGRPRLHASSSPPTARSTSTPTAPAIRPATPPTATPSVGTYATGWTQFRIVYDFTSQTYTLSKRASATDAWTPLKAAGAPATASRSAASTPSPPPTATSSAPTRTPTCGSTTWPSPTVTVAPSTHTLTYSAGAHGAITGAATQTVAHGASGTPVTATPSDGYHFLSWSDGLATASRTDTNVVGDKTVSATFEADQLTLDYSRNPFDTAPVLSATKAAGVWYKDRYVPSVFENADFDGQNRLHVGISSADYQASDFYNTQGRSFDLTDGQFVEADLYVGSDWDTNARRADMWSAAVDAGGATKGWPIIGFLNGTGFRVWDNTGWHVVGFPAGFSYGKWYSLKMMLNPTSVTYYIDDKLVYTSSFSDDPEMASAVSFSNVMLQAKNFNNTYDVYWDNVATTKVDEGGHVVGANQQVIAYGTDGAAVTAVPAEGYEFVAWSDGVTTPTRTDTGVTASISVYAVFEPVEVGGPIVIGSSRLTGTGMTATTDQHASGAGSWHYVKPGGVNKASLYVDPATDFGGATFTVADIESISYKTMNHANPMPVDFYLTIYTAGTAHGWYEQRLTAEPYFKAGAPYAPVLDTWQTWTTTGTEALRIHDSNNCGSYGFYGAPTLQQIQAGAINWSTWPSNPTKATSNTNPIDYSTQQVKYLTFESGSGWASFDGYLDSITVTLKNGTTYDVDLEATP